MAAASHDPKFAKKVGIPQKVAKEFNKADEGTPLLSRANSVPKSRKSGRMALRAGLRGTY
jgi:hypothetical protein